MRTDKAKEPDPGGSDQQNLRYGATEKRSQAVPDEILEI